MCKVAITHDELTAKVLAAIHAHQGCELVREIAITPVQVVGAGMTWHASLVDSGLSDPVRAASVLRQTREELEPRFTLVNPAAEHSDDKTYDTP
jgi:hypothetical protein